MTGQIVDTRVGVVYCRVPHPRDPEQIPVDVQERICRGLAVEAGVAVSARRVFVDGRRSVWRPGGDRSGWLAMLAAVRSEEVDQLLLHVPGLAEHSPADVLELLHACRSRGVVLPGLGDGVDLGVEEQWQRVVAEAERACQAAESRSRAARSAHEVAAAAGRPHGGGRRRYGYASGMAGLVPAEAAVVVEIFDRFLAGVSLRSIAWSLTFRGVRNASGGGWSSGSVARIISSPHYAGFRVFRGQILLDDEGSRLSGDWEPCVPVEDWDRAQELRAGRRAAEATTRRPDESYALTGLLLCEGCGTHMVGSAVAGYRMYACAGAGDPPTSRCARYIGADTLEAHVEDQAVGVLETWDGADPDTLPVTAAQTPGPDCPAPRGAITRGLALRPAGALDGVRTGPAAPSSWAVLSQDRRDAVVRFLFATILVGPKTTARNIFDYDRIRMLRHAA